MTTELDIFIALDELEQKMARRFRGFTYPTTQNGKDTSTKKTDDSLSTSRAQKIGLNDAHKRFDIFWKTDSETKSKWLLNNVSNENKSTLERSEAEKMRNNPNSLRKRSYISRLMIQNKKQYFKSSNSKSSQMRPPLGKTGHRFQSNRISSDGGISTASYSSRMSPSKPNSQTYTSCFLPRLDKFKKYSLVGKVQPLSTGSSTVNSVDAEDFKINHIVYKYAHFSQEILKTSGKLSTENVNLIINKIRNILEEDRKQIISNERISSKKKTISFIKKILHGGTIHVSKHAPRRKKPHKKYFIETQVQDPWPRTKSFFLANLFIKKINKSKSKKGSLTSKCSTNSLRVNNVSKKRSSYQIDTKPVVKENVSKTNDGPSCSKNNRSDSKCFNSNLIAMSAVKAIICCMDKSEIFPQSTNKFQAASSKQIVKVKKEESIISTDSDDLASSDLDSVVSAFTCSSYI